MKTGPVLGVTELRQFHYYVCYISCHFELILTSLISINERRYCTRFSCLWFSHQVLLLMSPAFESFFPLAIPNFLVSNSFPSKDQTKSFFTELLVFATVAVSCANSHLMKCVTSPNLFPCTWFVPTKIRSRKLETISSCWIQLLQGALGRHIKNMPRNTKSAKF